MNKINELAEKINYHRDLYYNGSSVISDAAYDELCDELEGLDPNHPAITSIGAGVQTSEWEKYKHKIPLGSLNKVNNPDDFAKWALEYVPENDFFTTLKLDGLSVSLVYENGKLIVGASRGSGIEGENILKNVVKMRGVPKTLPNNLTATIRGEILIFTADFEKHFKAEYSNPRNCASGTSRRYDGVGCEYLTVMCYQLTSDELKLETEVEQFETLKKLGFNVPEYHLLNSIKDVVAFKEEFQANRRDNFEVGLDGLVIRVNNLKQQISYGYKHQKPVGAKAYKFTNEKATTKILDITLSVGNGGRIVPVAILDPVDIGGASIGRASLYNFSYIKELKLDIGAEVIIERGGEIPIVSSVIKGTNSIFPTPTKCPDCNGKAEMIGENLFCLSVDDCSSQVIGRLDNWLTNLNVLEWGQALLEKLVISGKVKTISDLYKLTEDDLSSLERMGIKSAQNCLKTLHSKKTIPLKVFLGSLTIPLIGRSMIKMVIEAGYDDLDKILNAKVSDFESIKGFSHTKASALFNGLIKNKQLINELREIIMIEQNVVENKVVSNGKLNGKSIVITGKTDIKRKDLQTMIEAAGGSLKPTVKEGVDYLVIVDAENSQTIKAKAARSLNVKLISEKELLGMME